MAISVGPDLRVGRWIIGLAGQRNISLLKRTYVVQVKYTNPSALSKEKLTTIWPSSMDGRIVNSPRNPRGREKVTFDRKAQTALK